ncbi:MAG: YbgA family protein [Campylobacterota bacterium]
MKIAVSSCLLGNEVRYNGGHKRDKFITDTLSKYCEYAPFCPEDIAFKTPRDAMRLVEHKDRPLQVVTVNSGKDLTQDLTQACQDELTRVDLKTVSGIIFQAKSPSCGFGSAKTYLTNGYSSGKTDGLFVQACKEVMPHLPMEEEARLNDAWLRENFIMQLFAYDDMKKFAQNATQFKELVAFHTAYKYLLLSKDEPSYRELGQIVANHNKNEFDEVVATYKTLFEQTIAQKSRIGKTVNVLDHMVGFFKYDLTSDEKGQIRKQINQFKDMIVPLITVISMIKLFAIKHNTTYLLEQKFLDPYPEELALRSDIKSAKTK